MPIYEAELSDGTMVELESDHEPTPEELQSLTVNLSKEANPQGATPAPTEEEAPGALQTFGTELAKGVLPAMAANFGGQIGRNLAIRAVPSAIASKGASLLPLAGMVVGGAAAGMGAGAAEESVLNAATPEFQQQAEAGRKAHPIAAGLGSLGSMATAFQLEPGQALKGIATIPALVKQALGKGTTTEAQQRAATALATQLGVQAGLTVGVPAITQKRLPTVPEAVEGAAAAVLFGRPRFPTTALLPSATKAARTAIQETEAGNASKIGEAAAVSELEVRPQVGGETPLRQSGKAAGEGEITEQGLGEEASVLLGEEPAPKPAAQPAKKVYVLQPSEKAYLEAERKSIDVPVEEVDLPTSSTDPFARTRQAGQFMGINRQKGTIEVYPEEFSAWLQSIPEGRRQLAVRSRLAEERLHLGVSDADAQAYWDNATWAERKSIAKKYTGTWSGINPTTKEKIPDYLLGHEMVRYRLQQLARMTPSEIAESRIWDRLTLRGLDTLDAIVRNLRRVFGTRASEAQIAILDRIQENLGVARQAQAGAEPAALRRKSNKDYFRDYLELMAAHGKYTTDEVSRYAEQGPLSTFKTEGEAKPAYWLAKASDLYSKLMGDSFDDSYRGLAELVHKGELDPEKWYNENLRYYKPQGGLFGEHYPAAIRRKPDIFTESLRLDPVPRGTKIERGEAFPAPKPGEVERVSTDWFNERATKPIMRKVKRTVETAPGVKEEVQVPTEFHEFPLDEFTGRMQRDFGANVSKDTVQAAYQDGLVQTLMNSSGEKIEKLLAQHGLWKDVMESSGSGKIPDPVSLTQREFTNYKYGSIPASKRLARMQTKYQKADPQRRRLAAIGALLEKITGKASIEPKPWTRTEIGPEDIGDTWSVIEGEKKAPLEQGGAPGMDLMAAPEVVRKPKWHTVTPEERQNIVLLGKLATFGAGADRTTKIGKVAPPVSASHNLIALRDNATGQIVLVSVWKEPLRTEGGVTRGGVKITDPTNPNGPAKNLDDGILKQFTPTVIMGLRHPIQGYHEVWNGQQAFDDYWGDVGIEGTEGLKTSSFAGPEAGIARAQAGLSAPGRPLPEGEALDQARIAAANARRMIMGAEPPGKQVEVTSPTGRGAIPAARRLYPQPQPARREQWLTPEAEAQAEAKAELLHPFTPTSEQGVVGEFQYGKPTGKIVTAGKPKPMGPGWPLRAGPARAVREASFGKSKASYQPSEQRYPAAIIRTARDTTRDTLAQVKASLGAYLKRRAAYDTIIKTQERVGNDANVLQERYQDYIRLASQDKANPHGKKEILSGANPMIASGAVEPIYHMDAATQAEHAKLLAGHPAMKAARNMMVSKDPYTRLAARSLMRVAEGQTIARLVEEGKIDLRKVTWTFDEKAINILPHFIRQLDNAIATATKETANTNLLKARVARLRLKAAKEMKAEVQYALHNWKNPELRETARRTREVLNEQWATEKEHGFKYRYDEDYLPGRYRGDLWNDFSIAFPGMKVLGHNFSRARKFANYYAAIEAGNYIPMTRDVSAIAGHRVRSGMFAVNSGEWVKGLKNVTDEATGEPAVTDMMVNPDGTTRLPSLDYEAMTLRKGQPVMAVKKSFAPLLKQLTEESDPSEFVRTAIRMGSALKHTILLGDFFHLGRMFYYGASIMGRKSGFREAFHILEYRKQDLAEALRKGGLTPEEYKWATEPIVIQQGNRKITTDRYTIADAFTRQGLNIGRIQDAIYADMVQNVPFFGKYNQWLFGKLTRGLMLQSAITSFERLNARYPNTNARVLMRDIAKDVNRYFGNLGKEGFFKSQRWQEYMRMVFLAPQWVEGLVDKELGFTYRMLGGAAVRSKQGLPPLGVIGGGIGKGLVTMIAATQAINLFTTYMTQGKAKWTWENDDEGHKFDAWIPGMDGKGFWFSPLAIFNELTHDLIRLGETKPKVWDAIEQIGENKMSPWGRLALVLIKSKEPGSGSQITTTPGVLASAAKQLGPVPLSFGKYMQLGLTKATHGWVPPPAPGSIQRQSIASFGIKVEPQRTAVQEIAARANRFMEESGLKKETGWMQVPTDDPSYSKLRGALRNNDEHGAARLLEGIRRTHTDRDIVKAMNLWLRRPFTGSARAERQFLGSLSADGLSVYNAAQTENQRVYEAFTRLLSRSPATLSPPRR